MNSLLRSLSLFILSLACPLNAEVLPSEIEISPKGPYQVTTDFGTATELSLSIQNLNSSESSEIIAVFKGETDSSLESTLQSLNDSAPEIINLLTDRYLFRDGLLGASIGDGGGDMYDSGNFLRFGSVSASALTYSNNAVTNGEISYFTRKYDGLFVLAADYGEATSVE